MNVIVRFYWQHDLDLVALNMHPDFDMGPWMKRAIVAYARGDEDFYIPLPRSMPYSVELDNCCTHFRLTPGKDDDVIAVLNGFRSGFRNSTIKIIFRQYLKDFYLDPFLNEETFLSKSRVHGKSAETANRPSTTATAKTVKKKTGSTPAPQKHSKAMDVQKEPEKYTRNSAAETISNSNISETESLEKRVEPIIDLSQEESGFEDGDTFNLFSAVNKLMQ